MNKKLLTKGTVVALVGLFTAPAMAEVSISGWINQGLTYADGDAGSDIVSVADNGNTLGSRLTFSGSTDVPGGLTAGFDATFEMLNGGRLGFGTGGKGTVDSFSNQNGDIFNVLGHSVFISGQMGKVTLGLQSMPTDNIAVLEDPSLTLWPSISPVFRGNAILINQANPTVAFGDALTCFTAEALNGGLGIGIDCNGIYRQGVRYDLPTFVDGLGIAVGHANDDVYDISAKYKTTMGRLSVQGAIGYAENNGVQAATHSAAENLQIQVGVMDSATGLFVTGAYQQEDADLEAGGAGMEDSTDAYWFKGGIKRQFNSLGDTAIAGQFGLYNDQYSAAAVAAAGGAGVITGSELQRIGVEVSQYFGSSLIVYGTWENLDAEFDGASGLDGDIDLFTLGVTYFF